LFFLQSFQRWWRELSENIQVFFVEIEERMRHQNLFDEAMDRFREALREARQFEPNQPDIMTLATCSADGHPTARTMTLKEANSDGLVFYTNELSVKGRQLAENPRLCAVFYWSSLKQQVVFEGTVSVLDEQTTDAYWRTRPRDNQLTAWACEQSKPLADHQALLQRLNELRSKYDGGKVPRPAYWLGYCLAPTRIEFWKADWRRLNERLSYDLSDRGWTKQLLNP
jgi:pyridoxamine 5'-phosphate oxidase